MDVYKLHRPHFVFQIKRCNLKLICQECGGSGGEVEPVLDDGSGPWEPCGMCEGTGYTSPHDRGMWLRWKKEEKKRNASP